MNFEFVIAISKFTVVLALGMVLVAMMRNADGAAKHFALMLTLAFAILAPFVALPGLKTLVSDPTVSLPAPELDIASSALIAEPNVQFEPDTNWFFYWIYGVIAALFLLRVVVGLVAIYRIKRRHPDLLVRKEFSRSCQVLGIRQRAKIKFAKVSSPLTFGCVKPVVAVPDEFADWPEELRQSTMLHELAHIQRFDWVWMVVLNVIHSVTWCHPLVWLFRKNVRELAEQAADERVIAAGVPASDYAGHLLAVAQSLQKPKGFVHPMGVMMMKQNTLNKRVTQILAPKRRGFTTIGALLMTGAFGLSFLAVTSVRVSNQDPVIEVQGQPIQDTSPKSVPSIIVEGAPIQDRAVAPRQKAKAAKSKSTERRRIITRRGYALPATPARVTDPTIVEGRPLPPMATDPFQSESIAPVSVPRGTAKVIAPQESKVASRGKSVRTRNAVPSAKAAPSSRKVVFAEETIADPVASASSSELAAPLASIETVELDQNSGTVKASAPKLAKIQGKTSASAKPVVARVQTKYSPKSSRVTAKSKRASMAKAKRYRYVIPGKGRTIMAPKVAKP